MLILQRIIEYALTHKYSEEHEKFLDECYFSIWGKGEKAKLIIELWKNKCFDIPLIPVRYVEDRIDDLYFDQEKWNDDTLNLDEIDALETLLKKWEEAK